MSWLNISGNLSSMANSVTSFTREVLTEAKNESYHDNHNSDDDDDSNDHNMIADNKPFHYEEDPSNSFSSNEYNSIDTLSTLQEELNLLKSELSCKDDQIYYLQQENNKKQLDYEKHVNNLKQHLIEKENEIGEVVVEKDKMLQQLTVEKNLLESQLNESNANEADNDWAGDWGEMNNDELESIRTENESLSNEVMMKEIILQTIETKMTDISGKKVDVADFDTWLDNQLSNTQEQEPNKESREILNVIANQMKNSNDQLNPTSSDHVQNWILGLKGEVESYKTKIKELEQSINEVEMSMSNFSGDDYSIEQFHDWLQTVNKNSASNDLLLKIEKEIQESDDEYEDFKISSFHEWFEKTQCQIDDLEVELLNEQETREAEEQQRIAERATLTDLFKEKQNEIALLKVELYNKTSGNTSPGDSEIRDNSESEKLSALQDQLNESNARYQGLQDELLSLQRRNEGLSTSQEDLDTAIMQCDNYLEDLRKIGEEKAELQNQVVGLNKKIELLEKELSTEQNDNQHMQERLTNSKLFCEELQGQVNELQAYSDNLQQQVHYSQNSQESTLSLQSQLEDSTRNYQALQENFEKTLISNSELNDSVIRNDQEICSIVNDIKLIDLLLQKHAKRDYDTSIEDLQLSSEKIGFLCTSLKNVNKTSKSIQKELDNKNDELLTLTQHLYQKDEMLTSSQEQAQGLHDIVYNIATVLDGINLNVSLPKMINDDKLYSNDSTFYISYMDNFGSSINHLLAEKDELSQRLQQFESTPHNAACGETEETSQSENTDELLSSISSPRNGWSGEWENQDGYGTDLDVNEIDADDESKSSQTGYKGNALSSLQAKLTEEKNRLLKELEEHKSQIVSLENEILELKKSVPLPTTQGSAGGMKFGALKRKVQELEKVNVSLQRENDELKNNFNSPAQQTFPNVHSDNSLNILASIAQTLDSLDITETKIASDGNLCSSDPEFIQSYIQDFKSNINEILVENKGLSKMLEDLRNSVNHLDNAQLAVGESEHVAAVSEEVCMTQNIQEVNTGNMGWDNWGEEQQQDPVSNTSTDEISVRSAELDKIKEELLQHKELTQNLQSENVNLQKTIAELQKSLPKVPTAGSSGVSGMKFGALKRKIQELEATNENLLNEIGSLKNAVQNSEGLNSVGNNTDNKEIQNLSNLLMEKTSECQYYYAESEQLKATLNSMQNDMQTIQGECYQLKVMLHDQQNQMQAQDQDQTSNNLEYFNNPQVMSPSVQQQQDQLHTLSLRFTEKSEECQQLQYQCEHLNSRVLELENDTSDLELIREECKQLKSMLVGKEHESRVDETIHMLQMESKQLKNLMIEKENEYQNLQKVLLEKENELSDMELLREECKQLKQMLVMQPLSGNNLEEEMKQKDAMIIEMQNSISDMELLREECKQLKTMLLHSQSEQNKHSISSNDDQYAQLQSILHDKENVLHEKNILIEKLQNDVHSTLDLHQQSGLNDTSINTSAMNATNDFSQNSFLIQVEQLEEMMKEKDEIIAQKDVELQQMNQQLVEMQNSASDMELLHSECRALKEMIVEKENKFSELLNDLDSANDMIQQKNGEMKLKSNELNQLQIKLEETFELVDTKEREYSLLQEELTESIAQDENIHLLQTEYRNIEERLKSTEKELEAHTEKLFAAETHCERLKVYEEQYNSLKQALQEKEEALNTLKLQSSESSILESETVTLLHQELNELKSLVYERENRISELTSILEKKTIELQNLFNESRETMSTLQNNLTNSQDQNNMLIKNVEILEQQCREHADKENCLEIEIGKLRKEVDSIKPNSSENQSDAATKLGNELSQIKTQENLIQQLKDELKNIDIKVENYEAEKEQSSILLGNERERVLELESLLQQEKSKAVNVSKLQQSSSPLMVKAVCENCQKLKDEIYECERVVVDLKTSLSMPVDEQKEHTFLTDIRAVQFAVDKKLLNFNELQSRCLQFEKENQDLKEKYDSEVSHHESSFIKTTEDFEFKIKDLQSQLLELNELESDYQNLRIEKEHSDKKLSNIQNDYNDLSQLLEEERTKRNQDGKLAAQHANNLEDQLSCLQEEYQKRIKESESAANSVVVSECDRLRDQLEQNSHSYLNKNKECDQLKLDVLQLEDKVHQLQLSNGKLLKNSDKIKMLEQFENENSILKSTIEDLETQLENGKKEKALLEELMQLKAKLEQDNTDLSFQTNQLSMRVQEQDVLLKHRDISIREIEAKAARELDRLRNHLMMMEESHTKDILESQDREKLLQQQLDDSKQVLSKKAIILQDSSKQFQEHVTEIEEQLHQLTSQRDTHMLELSKCKEKIEYDAQAIYNLQSALEQLQRDKTEQYEYMVAISKRKENELQEKITSLTQEQQLAQTTMSEASLAVQGISKMTLELQQKENELKVSKEKIIDLMSTLEERDIQCNKMMETSESKLDKSLIRNLLLKYFQSPEDKRADIVKVIGGLLGIPSDQVREIGSGAVPSKVGGWISNVWGYATPKKEKPSLPPTPNFDANQSFSELFVKFLENASDKNNAAVNTASLTLTNEPSETPSVQMFTPATPDILAFHNNRNDLLSSGQRIPAPGQEIPRVHTHHAQSTLKNLLS